MRIKRMRRGEEAVPIRGQVPIRLCYHLGLSLVLASYVCSIMTTKLVMQKGKGALNQTRGVEEVWPPKSFFRNIQGFNNDRSRLVVTIINYDYVDFADNFAQSLLRQNVSNFCLVPTDKPAYGT
jgi:hypothetical protein